MASKSTSVKLTMKVASFVLRLLMNIVFYILVVVLIIDVSKMAFEFTYQLYGPVTVDNAPGVEITFQIKEGESTMDVSNKLETYAVIKNRYAFYLKTKLQHSVIMPGTYIINTAMTYDEILSVITDYSQSIVKEEAGTDTGSQSDTNTDTGTNAD